MALASLFSHALLMLPGTVTLAAMKLKDLTDWLDGYLDLASFKDISLNGLQVEGSETVQKIALAVDSSLETFEKAAESEADMLIVHHGLFWGKPLALTGMHKARIKTLFEHDISLYAAHIPLDAHKEVGNNWGLAKLLTMENLEDFGEFKGSPIGVKGQLSTPTDRRILASLLEEKLGEPIMMIEGGPAIINTLGIISGGAAWDVITAANHGLDAFLTGEPRHEIYHDAIERGINALFGGHYSTETVGVNLLAQRLVDEFKLDVEFIYLSTGL